MTYVNQITLLNAALCCAVIFHYRALCQISTVRHIKSARHRLAVEFPKHQTDLHLLTTTPCYRFSYEQRRQRHKRRRWQPTLHSEPSSRDRSCSCTGLVFIYMLTLTELPR